MVALPSQHTDDHYKQMWMHERNRRIEVEQEVIRLRKIVYNTKFSVNERLVAIEIVDQIQEDRHADEQGRKLFSQKQAAEKTGLSRNTIGTAVDILEKSGFITDKDTSSLKDKEGKKVNGKDGNPIYTTHLKIDQDLFEDFSKVERAEPRKIGKDRKTPVYACRECGTEEVTIKETKSLICKNPNCSKCGHEVVIEAPTYTEQKSANNEEPNTEEDSYSAQNLGTIELMDNSAQNLGTIETESESNNPPISDSPSPDHIAIISDWLKKRRGTPRIIQATGILKTEDKYISKASAYEPDIEAYIQGKIGHIYGSWLRNDEIGLTSVVSFDFDSSEHNDQAQDCLLDLARVGAAAIYWQRQRDRGHLEVYFDQPVNPEIARKWLLEVCPDLESIPECFPCDGIENRTNHALSWPMWQRIGGQVHPCKALAILPAPHAGGLQEIDPTDLEQLAQLVTNAVTPPALIEEFATVLAEREKLQSREQEIGNGHGGVIGINPSPITHVQSDRDLAKQAIADFNRSNRIEDMVELNKKRKFAAIWRGERTPSVALDRSGEYATDYGQNGSFPKKLDAYELYCLLNNIDKKADLAERCALLRRQQIKIVEPEATATELFPTEQKQNWPVYAICPICSTPKSMKRADGVPVCENECKG